jgi:hypothetical protein
MKRALMRAEFFDVETKSAKNAHVKKYAGRE